MSTHEELKRFDVRIVEVYGRFRVLAEFRNVRKPAARRLLGAALVAGPRGGGDTWVQPRVEVKYKGLWCRQRHDLNPVLGKEFLQYVNREVQP